MITGSCLCGGVRYQVARVAGPMVNCHCGMCRKAHGATFATIQPVAKPGFTWTAGEDLLSHYDSSPGKRSVYCRRCGSQVISTRDDNEESLLLRAGCIDEAPDAKPAAHGWVGSKAPWHEIADDLPRFERGFPGSPPGVDE